MCTSQKYPGEFRNLRNLIGLFVSARTNSKTHTAYVYRALTISLTRPSTLFSIFYRHPRGKEKAPRNGTSPTTPAATHPPATRRATRPSDGRRPASPPPLSPSRTRRGSPLKRAPTCTPNDAKSPPRLSSRLLHLGLDPAPAANSCAQPRAGRGLRTPVRDCNLGCDLGASSPLAESGARLAAAVPRLRRAGVDADGGVASGDGLERPRLAQAARRQVEQAGQPQRVDTIRRRRVEHGRGGLQQRERLCVCGGGGGDVPPLEACRALATPRLDDRPSLAHVSAASTTRAAPLAPSASARASRSPSSKSGSLQAAGLAFIWGGERSRLSSSAARHTNGWSSYARHCDAALGGLSEASRKRRLREPLLRLAGRAAPRVGLARRAHPLAVRGELRLCSRARAVKKRAQLATTTARRGCCAASKCCRS